MFSQDVIEAHKQMMMAETLPLLESKFESPSDVDIRWDVRYQDDLGILMMTVKESDTGKIVVEKSMRIQQLNG